MYRIKINLIGYLNKRMIQLIKSSRIQQNEIKEKLTTTYENKIKSSLFLSSVLPSRTKKLRNSILMKL